MNDPSTLQHAFADNFSLHGELGAALSVWVNGVEEVSLFGGHRDREARTPWSADTFVLWWSATKGPAAACVLHVLQKKGLDPGIAVAEFWPEFAQRGKGRVTVAQLLSHQAGLPGVPGGHAGMLDHDGMVEELAAAAPLWEPGTTHGYHPRTFGYLADECVRRLAGGIHLGAYWRAHFAEPLGIDFWIGLPDDWHDRVAPIYPSRIAEPPEQERFFYREMNRPGSLQNIAFTSGGSKPVSAMNRPELRRAALPAIGGIGSARGIAKFYALLAGGGSWEGRQYFTPETMAWMTHPLVCGPDQVFLFETAFSAGFMMDPADAEGRKKRRLFGPSLSAFGHPGAGGSHAFADVENNVAFAYAINQMSLASLPTRRARPLVEALYASL